MQGLFNSEAQRFDQRFATFHHVVVRPLAWTYQDYVQVGVVVRPLAWTYQD